MFKQILLPVDGSMSGVPVVRKCLAFAKDSGAHVRAIHILPSEPLQNDTAISEDIVQEFRRAGDARARQILEEVQSDARELGVPCETQLAYHDQPYQMIIDAARDGGCDLICMASHGRKGASAGILGSETQKVLTHSQIPVLVFR
jgi:nucleotide-binding universal stress UspA family protein